MTRTLSDDIDMLPIEEVGAKLGLSPDALIKYGPHKAKLSRAWMDSRPDPDRGRMILVTAMTPTKFGEGKTTTSIGLGNALQRIGKSVAVCLREPSLGPVFGMKGGGTGGGNSVVVPPVDINLHFNGDLHAVTSAHNLLAAMIDNHLFFDNPLGLDKNHITWPRVMDMNDRALRDIEVSRDSKKGITHGGSFDITAASEVMAILCLSRSLEELRERCAGILVGWTEDEKPIFAGQLDAAGAMATLLKDALLPNLVQTQEGTPTFVHGGPFANIAHGCNSVLATETAMGLADYVVTEAGFGADLGAEKFLDIKCRLTGLRPHGVVLVATIRALKFHGGVTENPDVENVAAVETGCENLKRHIQNLRGFGLPVVVSVNAFPTDTQAEFDAVAKVCAAEGVRVAHSTGFADGGAGVEDLAHMVVDMAGGDLPDLKFTYPDDAKLADKIEAIATKIYGADGIDLSDDAARTIDWLEAGGWGDYPVCIAKTQYSLSADPKLLNVPTGYRVPVREVRLSAGARFVVAVCGAMMTMPGLSRKPAAVSIDVGNDGVAKGVF